jgi:hypothetical protein
MRDVAQQVIGALWSLQNAVCAQGDAYALCAQWDTCAVCARYKAYVTRRRCDMSHSRDCVAPGSLAQRDAYVRGVHVVGVPMRCGVQAVWHAGGIMCARRCCGPRCVRGGALTWRVKYTPR